MRPTPRDWSSFIGYGRYAASLGVADVTLDHRLHGLDGYGRAAEDIIEAVELLRADPHIDPERIALWCFSGAGQLLAPWLAEPPSWLAFNCRRNSSRNAGAPVSASIRATVRPSDPAVRAPVLPATRSHAACSVAGRAPS